jgi:phosphate transport system permease protein
MLWLCGGALALCLLMVFGLLALVVVQGGSTFWPVAATQVKLLDGTVRLGEVTRDESFVPSNDQFEELPESVRATAKQRVGADGVSTRRLLRTGNFDLTGQHFHWVPAFLEAEVTTPEWALVIERQTWGRFYGFPVALLEDGKAVVTEPAEILRQFEVAHGPARARWLEAEDIRKQGIGGLSDEESEARLHARAVELATHTGSEAHQQALASYEATAKACAEKRIGFEAKIRELEAENGRHALLVRTIDGTEKSLPLAEIVRAYTPNQLTLAASFGVYWDRWCEFLADNPRESNTEGGVWPAIFGTVLMTLLMSLLVVPFGVLAALYMREYAKAGFIISAVRVAVNNLAGVPSIVFGVFGLGFFCYIFGGSIDSLFYPERLPSPTFGKGALIWASLTLALLTLPVVIVSTEEALAAVPGSMREGSYACGASKWQTIRRIVLPRAMPGIMTGFILARARGAGEVAPLMLVGAVKFAQELPLDGVAPFLHPSRSFMHLGFHIYDLGFQSQNSEAAKPMVFTTTLLLIGVITLLNVFAIWLRSRLRRRFVGAQF